MFHVKQKRVAFRCPAGACLLCRLPTMPLVYFLSPIPPTPFPSGEGGDHKFISPGAPPLASPGLNPGGTGSVGAGAPGTPAAKPARHWLFSAMSVFFCPHPPDPLPDGKGRPRLFYARGSAPCIPGAKPGRHWLNRGAGAPGAPAAKPARHWLFLPHQCFLPPSPRPPSRREGGDFCFILPGAGAPGTPATEPARRWLYLRDATT